MAVRSADGRNDHLRACFRRGRRGAGRRDGVAAYRRYRGGRGGAGGGDSRGAAPARARQEAGGVNPADPEPVGVRPDAGAHAPGVVPEAGLGPGPIPGVQANQPGQHAQHWHGHPVRWGDGGQRADAGGGWDLEAAGSGRGCSRGRNKARLPHCAKAGGPIASFLFSDDELEASVGCDSTAAPGLNESVAAAYSLQACFLMLFHVSHLLCWSPGIAVFLSPIFHPCVVGDRMPL
mmetsp:Transcript_99673/g.266303  ORF Transcript_99673/g.266303 Transcript_99673/m.266303 type:complete len:234 (-) Transcript_99673:29-730(-)